MRDSFDAPSSPAPSYGPSPNGNTFHIPGFRQLEAVAGTGEPHLNTPATLPIMSRKCDDRDYL